MQDRIIQLKSIRCGGVVGCGCGSGKGGSGMKMEE